MRPRTPCRGNISPLCIPKRSAMARYARHASPGGNPWQVLRSMHPEKGLGREKRPFVARFARYVSKMGWFWQDSRAMYPKSAAKRRPGMHRAKILPGRGAFRCTGPSNHARHANLAILCRRTALALAASAPPNNASRPQPLCRGPIGSQRASAAASAAPFAGRAAAP